MTFWSLALCWQRQLELRVSRLRAKSWYPSPLTPPHHPPFGCNYTSSTAVTKVGKRSPTDLDRAGVLRVVQQPHGAVAFPVQTPDAAAHQSAQHLRRRAGEDACKFCSAVTSTTSASSAPTPAQRRQQQRVCGAAAAALVHRPHRRCEQR